MVKSQWLVSVAGREQLCQSKRGISCQASGIRFQVIKKGLPDKSGSPHCVITQFLNKSNITYEKCIFQN